MRYPNAATAVADTDVDVKTGRFERPAGPVQPLRKALGRSLAACWIVHGRRGWVAVGGGWQSVAIGGHTRQPIYSTGVANQSFRHDVSC
jgi:hypothetical protein